MSKINSPLTRNRSTTRSRLELFVIGGGPLTGVELVGELADELADICRAQGIDFAERSRILRRIEADDSLRPSPRT